MNKKTIGLVIGFIFLAVAAFYAGDKYASRKNTAPLAQNTNGFMRNGGINNSAGNMQRGSRTGGGFVSGQIVSKDANSITVELRATMGQNGPNGGTEQAQGQGSKIVFYTDKTSVMKTADGTMDDLTVGKNVSITGTANSDGSVSAQSIQIRPVAQIPQQ